MAFIKSYTETFSAKENSLYLLGKDTSSANGNLAKEGNDMV